MVSRLPTAPEATNRKATAAGDTVRATAVPVTPRGTQMRRHRVR
jgi:hypothetical protein